MINNGGTVHHPNERHSIDDSTIMAANKEPRYGGQNTVLNSVEDSLHLTGDKIAVG